MFNKLIVEETWDEYGKWEVYVFIKLLVGMSEHLTIRKLLLADSSGRDGSLFMSSIYYCLSAFWCATARMSELELEQRSFYLLNK